MAVEEWRYKKLLHQADAIDTIIRSAIKEASSDYEQLISSKVSMESYERKMKTLPDAERLQVQRDSLRFNAGEPYLTIPECQHGQNAPDIEIRIESLKQRHKSEQILEAERKRYDMITKEAHR